jgi:hypothetical protein
LPLERGGIFIGEPERHRHTGNDTVSGTDRVPLVERRRDRTVATRPVRRKATHRGMASIHSIMIRMAVVANMRG